jgi:hypothetical protein
MNRPHNMKIVVVPVGADRNATTKTLLSFVLSPSIRPSDYSGPTGKAAQGMSDAYPQIHAHYPCPVFS